METVIILNGAPRSGKDTFCDICHEEASCVVGEISMVDASKKTSFFIKDNFDMPELYIKDDKKRKFLYQLKKALDVYDISLNYVIDKYCDFMYDKDANEEIDRLFIIHAREETDINNLWFFLNNRIYSPKVYTVFINRNKVEKTYGNPADDNVYNYKYDYIIENNGTLEEYRESIRTFLNEIGVKLI